MLKIKLTDVDMRTYGDTKWVLGEWKEATGAITKPLCTDAWIHVYNTPLVAVFLNPVHANFAAPRGFVAETQGRGKRDGDLKCGYRRVRIIREIKLPVMPTTQRVAAAILCSLTCGQDGKFREWATKWLDGTDRTWMAAEAARAARETAAAVRAAARAEAAAAWAAAWAAEAAARAEAAAKSAARAAARAAEAAAWAAGAKRKLDLPAILARAMQY